MTMLEKRFTFRVLAILAVMLVTVSLTACSTLQDQIQKPTVRLANIAFLGGDLSQQTYGVTLEVDNPNGMSLPVRAISYSLRLADRDFASGLTRDAFSIPANGSENIHLEIRTNLLDSVSHLTRLLQGGITELDYQMSGDVQIDLPLLGPIPFSQTGRIPLTSAR